MGAAIPALQGRPADHTSGQMVAPNDCSLCHATTNWNSTALPAGHMPNPGGACAVCHTVGAGANYATLAGNAVLHTGISTRLRAMPRRHDAADLLQQQRQSESRRADPAAYPGVRRHRLQRLPHAANYVAGGFGPMNMTQATHAGVGATCNGCHEAGLSLLHGRGESRPAGPAGRSHHRSDGGAERLQPVPHHANWNSTALPAGHMPNPANQACSVCHTTAPADYSTATLAADAVLHTGISQRLRPMSRRHSAADLVQQLHSQGRRC